MVCDFLTTQAYWARWRSPADIEAQLDAAWRVVGAYDAMTGHMVGFARAWSDGVACAYLADVFVIASARGRGLGIALVELMVEHGSGRDFRWMLHTADAHRLYAHFGFVQPDSSYLERPARSGLGPTPPRSVGGRTSTGTVVSTGAELAQPQRQGRDLARGVVARGPGGVQGEDDAASAPLDP